MTYHVTTSDRVMHHIPGNSAADAICKALDRNRGLTVIDCFAGNVDMTANRAGRITYDIPAHKPLPVIDDGSGAPLL